MRVRRFRLSAATILAALGLAACGSAGGGFAGLEGAGSTLVAPLLNVWQPEYARSGGVTVSYDPIGSGGGIEQITARTVDFGASDAPMTPAQARACGACVEIPWALAATDVAYHVGGVPNRLRFSGPVLAAIWTGAITRWNAPALERLNPGVHLPPTRIVPIHRTDGSGDTFAFSDYLSKVSPSFATAIGHATTVNWPGGIGAAGNAGVGGALAGTNGSIAYIAIAYVLANHFDYGLIENAAGRFPVPGLPSISAAAAALTAVPHSGRGGISLTDPPATAPGAYPISTFTYVIVPRASRRGRVIVRFIDWAVTRGQRSGPALDFAPLPRRIVAADRAAAAAIR
ncbi:phosphate ABC transporter substrate-binding protein PstS [Conexibacter sp. DBS9H8]|uniref:phosphate ABC transporter substrate-binding protein PstS n=1 Tax=Conexibacter sp. DBS9H8 TaxID=2937801 RepID=UPI00200EFD7D|nr:phosphate ABC transporter substrate-binding protein PstS [Conexibacter sp. DBS9H8]